MSKGSVEDRLEIRELVETFAAGAMRLDSETWGSTWAEDGSWMLPSLDVPVQGKDNIVAIFEEKMAYVESMSMISFPSALDFDGDSARGKCYCRELIYPKGADQRVIIGCFDDEYVKRDGQWYFLSRTYEVMSMH